MAQYTSYGSWCASDDYRAKAVVDVTTANDKYTVKTTCQIQADVGWASGLTTTGTAHVGSTSASGTISSFSAGTTTTIKATGNVTVNRTHAEQTVTCKAVVSSYAGTSTATYSLKVPARPSYAITFNDNGGSGGPGSSTKWYGEAMDIPLAAPARENYRFLGWATSQANAASGTVAYQPGGSYPASSNAAATLWAVWELALIPPTISSLNVYRVSGASSVYKDDGTNAYVLCAWSVDVTLLSSNRGAKLAISHRAAGASSWTADLSVTLSAATATTGTNVRSTASGNALVTLSASSSYEVMVTVTDTQGASTSRVVTVSATFVSIDVSDDLDGRSIAFGRAASDSINEIGFAAALTPVFDDAAAWRASMGADDASNLTKGTVPRARIESTAWAYLVGSASASAYVRWRMVAGIVFVEVYYGSGAGLTAKTAKTFATMPEGYRPDRTEQNAAFLGSANNNLSEIWVESGGAIKGVAAAAASAFYGNVVYPL